jgi:DNA-binding NarL/FixJ family response regulator
MAGQILVALSGANDIVTAGLRALVAADPEMVVLDDEAPGVLRPIPDVIVYDASGLEDGGAELSRLVADSDSAVLVLSADLRPGLATRAMALGASGYFSIETEAASVVAMIRSAALGELVEEDFQPVGPGDEAGLSQRETDVVAEVVRGLSNEQIADKLGVSGNTIKSYIRSAYRKMGVESRSQAVAWGLVHGFEPPVL